jgi:hypothetical protein
MNICFYNNTLKNGQKHQLSREVADNDNEDKKEIKINITSPAKSLDSIRSIAVSRLVAKI